jgi:hypothetical protein
VHTSVYKANKDNVKECCTTSKKTFKIKSSYRFTNKRYAAKGHQFHRLHVQYGMCQDKHIQRQSRDLQQRGKSTAVKHLLRAR